MKIQFFSKKVAESLRKGRLLYLMGATWHNKCMFDVDSDEKSFATILQNAGIETYTFNNLSDHASNVNLAIKLITHYKIDYVLGYSYGCLTAHDVSKKIDIKGIMFLDPISHVKVTKQKINNTAVVTKDNVKLALIDNKVQASDSMRTAYISALSDTEELIVPVYPNWTIKNAEEFFTKDNFHLFLTSQSIEESRVWNPTITTYYPDSTHWILLEPGRYKLADDVVKFIQFNQQKKGA